MEVEHLWQYNETDPKPSGRVPVTGSSPDISANLCNIADHRLYKIVKWCKSLPLFKNISVSILFFLTIFLSFEPINLYIVQFTDR